MDTVSYSNPVTKTK